MILWEFSLIEPLIDNCILIFPERFCYQFFKAEIIKIGFNIKVRKWCSIITTPDRKMCSLNK